MSASFETYSAVALLEYKPQNPNEVPLAPNEPITVCRLFPHPHPFCKHTSHTHHFPQVLSLQGNWAIVRKSTGEKGLVPSAFVSEPRADGDGSAASTEYAQPSAASVLSSSSQDGPWRTSAVVAVKAGAEPFLSLDENEPVTVLDFFPPDWCRVEAHGSVGLVPKRMLNPLFIGASGVPSTSLKHKRPVLFLAQAKYNYDAKGKTEHSFKRGDVVGVKKEVDGGWYLATFNRRPGHVPASFFAKLDLPQPGPAAAPAAAVPPIVVPQQSPRSPRPLSPVLASPSSADAQKKRSVRYVLKKKTAPKDAAAAAQPPEQQQPPADDINALPTYDEIEPLTVNTLKVMIDEAEKRHAEEVSAMKSLSAAQLAEIDKLKKQVRDLEEQVNTLRALFESTLSQLEVVEEPP